MQTEETVLLVDDEASILDVLKLAFKKANLPVKTALNAEDALELLGKERFAAVVTDKNLPKKSGLDLLREVRSKHPYTACLIITGFVSTDSVLEALKLGADDYLLKPFESLTLVVERVKKAMTSQRLQRERAELGESLRLMEKTLRRSEAAAFQKGTELDLFQNVMELKLEDATRELNERVAKVEGELALATEKTAALRKVLLELADNCRDAAKTVAATSKAAADGYEKVAARLAAEAEILG